MGKNQSTLMLEKKSLLVRAHGDTAGPKGREPVNKSKEKYNGDPYHFIVDIFTWIKTFDQSTTARLMEQLH